MAQSRNLETATPGKRHRRWLLLRRHLVFFFLFLAFNHGLADHHWAAFELVDGLNQREIFGATKLRGAALFRRLAGLFFKSFQGFFTGFFARALAALALGFFAGFFFLAMGAP